MVDEILIKILTFFTAAIDTVLELFGIQTGPNWPPVGAERHMILRPQNHHRPNKAKK